MVGFLINPDRSKSGTTIVEVLVGFVILTIITLSILAAITAGAVFGVRSDKIYDACLIAQLRIEEAHEILEEIRDVDPMVEFLRLIAETDTPIDSNENGKIDHLRTTEVFGDFEGYSRLGRIKVTVHRTEDGERKAGTVVMETHVYREWGD